MLFRLDSESGVPFYQQIERQFKQMLAVGGLQPGDRLPTVRDLASQLVVNPNTVARAYLDLEREGVVETRRGQGTFACAPSSRLADEERRRIITNLLERVLAEAFNLNVSAAEVCDILEQLSNQRQQKEDGGKCEPLAPIGAGPEAEP